ncbi:MAG TPA: hypothetical protein DD415_05085 [Clostridiales bacterium]|nr:hypothetical protein [Clostridiales bacterium]
MLSKYENEVMAAVYSLCDGLDSCLVSPLEILSVLPEKRKYSLEKVDGILHDLMCDGYFDLITSERKGEKMYVINLKANGLSYKRNAKQKQRDIAFRIMLAFIGAAATFVFGLIIKSIFG